ncbi:phospholipase D family protein [Falsiruegeria litorea]|nr:phospholipase D family protein [Falsiruegeria litorea]
MCKQSVSCLAAQGINKFRLMFLFSLSAVVLAGCSPSVREFEKTVTQSITAPPQSYLENRSRSLGNPGDDQSGVRMLSNGEEALAARLLLAAKAEQTIDAQYYLLHDDPTGHLFVSSLLRAADRGVRVRLLLDDMATSGYDNMTAALDLHPNLEIRLFNPFWREKGKFFNALTDFERVNRRMHNKSMTFDNAFTIVGGRNIGAEYFLANDTSNYKDLDVLATGPVVREVSDSFDEYWNSRFAVPARVVTGEPEGLALVEVRKRLRQLEEDALQTEFAEALVKSASTAFARENFRVEWVSAKVYADPVSKIARENEENEILARQLLPYFENASKEVHIISAYFVPLNSGVKWLSELEERGVDVEVITNSITSNDVAVVYAHYAKKRKELLRAGVELYELRPDADQREKLGVNWETTRSGLHTKAFTIDDRYLFVGSFNFDPRSVRINTEMGIVIDSPRLVSRTIGELEEALPRNTYQLKLTEKDRIIWLTERDDKATSLFRGEPTGSLIQYIWAGFLGILPIGPQL